MLAAGNEDNQIMLVISDSSLIATPPIPRGVIHADFYFNTGGPTLIPNPQIKGGGVNRRRNVIAQTLYQTAGYLLPFPCKQTEIPFAGWFGKSPPFYFSVQTHSKF